MRRGRRREPRGGVRALVLGLLLAAVGLLLGWACGGGSDAAPAPVPAPTLTGFSPASGVVGSRVTLAGTALAGTTAVAFGSVPAGSYAILSDTQVQAVVPAGAVSAPLRITTSGGTAVSPASFTVLPSPAPTLAAFVPTSGPPGTAVTLTGTGFLGATGVAFGGVPASFAVADDTRIDTWVPAGAATGPLAVTTPGGTATSAAAFSVTALVSLDLRIDGLSLTQATQTYPAAVALVAGRRAWVRVFVRGSETNAVQPSVRVDFAWGTVTRSLTIPAPGASVPTAVDEAATAASWNAAVPAEWVQPGLAVRATVDPDGAVAESDETNNRYPADGTALALPVEPLAAWKVRFLPVTTGDGRTGAVDATTVPAYVDMALRVHPVADAVDAALGPALTSSVEVLTSDDQAWGTVLDEVTAKWNADGRPATYFGVVNPAYAGGIVGMGWVGQAVAVGWDREASRAGVVAHEVGHTFGRLHAPCGDVADPDPAYPVTGDYVGGHIGVTGWDVFAILASPKAAALYTDVMGYCSTQWVSDYTYAGALAYRRAHPAGVAAAAAEGLLIWGHLEGDRVVLQPAIRLAAPPAPPEPGPFRWEARDAVGGVRLAADFQAPPVADASGGRRMFSFVVPLGTVAEADLASLHVLEGGVERARALRREPPSRLGAPEAIQASDEAEGVGLAWDPLRYPLVVVRDAATGELLGFQRGGAGRLRTGRRDLELLACDGVATRVQSFRRRP